MGRLKLTLCLIILFFLLIGSSTAAYVYYWLDHPVLKKNQTVEYYVPHGASFKKTIYGLSEEKIISHPKLFILYTNFVHKLPIIKYGTYRFTGKDTPKSILAKLIRGDTILVKITIPEGLNIWQTAQKLEQYFPTVSAQQWFSFFSSPTSIQTLGLKEEVKNIEGFFFPQTYFFDPHPEPQFITKSILNEFKKYVTPQMFDKAKSMGLTPLQFITLASIVEKETSISSERNMVSAVYWNRLKKGMPLQADPTTIYGVLNERGMVSQQVSLTKKDLLTKNPYNTYTFKGLPVGPIASPGLESILATLNPAKTDALYFVATGYGGHVFSKTLQEHNKAVRQYIRYLKTEKKKNNL
ncbi:MAG: endolytic transglycosylase MltG [Bdellovibrionota bacterium]